MGERPIRRRQGRGAGRAALASLLACFALDGCGLGAAFSSPTGPTSGGAVTEAVVGTVGSLNPLFAENDNSRDIDSLIYRGLIAIDAEENPVPDLAESWSVTPDRLTYTFQLRDDVTWADGQPLTVQDVLFTFAILQSSVYQGGAQAWQAVSVQLAGERDVRFILKGADSAFMSNLRVGIIPQHVFKDVAITSMANDPASAAKAFGSGPYLVDSISKDRKVVTLRRNPHARPAPRLDQIVFRGYPTLGDAVEAVVRGEADAVGALQPPQLGELAKRPELIVRQMRTYSAVNVVFNRSADSAPFFGSDAVRRALNEAVDRRPLVNQVLEGRADAAPGPIPPSDWAFSRSTAEKYSFDRQSAMSDLAAAGWNLPAGADVRSKDGRDFSITLSTADAYPYKQVADELSRQFRQVGIDLKIDPVPASVLLGRLLQKQYQLALVGFDLGPDPDQYSLWHSPPPASPGAPPDTQSAALNFANPKLPRQALIDKDLEDGRSAPDRRARRPIYNDFQDLMADAAPALFLFQPRYAYVVSRRVHAVRTNPVIEPADRFQFVSEWWVSKTA